LDTRVAELGREVVVQVRRYAGSLYERINKVLRGLLVPGTDPAGRATTAIVAEATAGVDRAVAASSLQSDLVLYRGASSGFLERLQIGVEFSDAGFGSWTGRRSIGGAFATASASVHGGTSVLFRMRARAGTQALYVGSREDEFILARGRRYRIAAIEPNINVFGGRRMTVVTLDLLEE